MSLTVKVEGKCYKLSKEKTVSWAYFTPLVDGRWGDKPHELTLTKDQYQAWTRLNVTTGLVSYSSVIAVVDLLLPENDEWTTRVYLDDDTTQEQRMEHYERVGNYVRAMGKKLAYVGLKFGVHANFSLYRDLAYKTRYESALTEEQKDLLLSMRNLSLITGIVHDTWLRCRVEQLELDKYEEVPWCMVRWQDVAQVEYPNALTEIKERIPQPEGISKPGVADKYRERLIKRLLNKEVEREDGTTMVKGLSWTQYVVGNYLRLLPDSDGVSPCDFHTMRVFSRQDGERTRVTTGFVLSDSMLHELYLAILRKPSPAVCLLDILVMGPITGIIRDRQYLYTSAVHGLLPCKLLTHVTANILYRGESLVTLSGEYSRERDTRVVVALVNRDDFPAVVKYGMTTVGSEAMTLLADLLRERQGYIPTDRDKLFCHLVKQQCDPGKYELTCLP